ncbi:unnamed protein product [Debaryomyces fabryi]|nr:unnamed protein product [Debaryomyces fabryi]
MCNSAKEMCAERSGVLKIFDNMHRSREVKQRDCGIAGLRDCGIAGVWDCGSVGLRECGIAGLRECGIAG